MSTKEERRATAAFCPRARKVLEVLNRFEQDEIRLVPFLGTALEAIPLTFVVFACLGTRKGVEELKLDLFETIFLKRFRREAEKLFRVFADDRIEATLQIILPDREPRRTWGWGVPQEELTAYCRMMAEDAASKLLKAWSVLLWSDLEQESAASYDAALAWAQTSAHPLIVREERQFFRELGERHPDILMRGDPEAMALRQIAAYAHEGRTLETVFPNAFLLQTDTPVGRKDGMFQLLRKQALPIAHPFTR